MSSIVTRGYGVARQGIITRGYGRALEDIIDDAIEEVTGIRPKRKGRSRQSRRGRDEEQEVEHYTLEVSLKRVNDTVIDVPIRNKIMESIQKNEGLRMKVTHLEVASETSDDDTRIKVTATIKKGLKKPKK